MIAYVTGIRYMPPWKADRSHLPIQGQRGLSDLQISQIRQWVENGMPQGPAIPIPVEHKKDDKQHIRQADAVFSMARSFEQYGVYYDQYRVFVLPTGLAEDKWIEAVEFVPGNRSILRSAMISVDVGDKVLTEDEWDPGYGYFSYGELGFIPAESRWYNWSPGQGATYFAEDQALFLPKGAKLMLHLHYGPTGYPQLDSSVIKVKYRREAPARRIQTAPLIHPLQYDQRQFLYPRRKDHPLPRQVYPARRYGDPGPVPPIPPAGQQMGGLCRASRRTNRHYPPEDLGMGLQLEANVPLPKTGSAPKRTVLHAIATYDNTAATCSIPTTQAGRWPGANACSRRSSWSTFASP